MFKYLWNFRHFIALMATFVGIALINNVVLLRIHPLAYYYTPRGILLTASVMLVESPIVSIITGHNLKKISEDLKQWE